jgi:hypothetical protein
VKDSQSYFQFGPRWHHHSGENGSYLSFRLKIRSSWRYVKWVKMELQVTEKF